MPSITLENQKIFYAQNRRPHPTTLVFIHGAGGRHQDWPSELRRLEGVETLTPDLPGHGRSDLPGRETIDRYADFISSFVEGLGRQNVVCVGHSMGSAIALTLGIRRPSWLSGIVLLGASAAMPVTPVILDNVKTDIAVVADFFTKYAWGKSAKFQHKGFARRHLLEHDPDVLYGDYAGCNVFDVNEALGEVEAPTLVISGEKDKFVRVKQSQTVVDGIPNAKHAVIQAAGHMMMLEFPDKTGDLITGFLKENRLWAD